MSLQGPHTRRMMHADVLEVEQMWMKANMNGMNQGLLTWKWRYAEVKLGKHDTETVYSDIAAVYNQETQSSAGEEPAKATRNASIYVQAAEANYQIRQSG